MMARRGWLLVVGILLPGACGSVAVPEEQRYRLEWPRPAGGELPQMGVLRVLDLDVASHLQTDGLVVAEGPVRLRTCDLHRWAAPLDRLVTEALIQGLARTRMFALVKGAGDSGGEDLVLGGRVLAFEMAGGGEGVTGRAVLEAWVEQGSARRRLELRAEVPCRDGSPEAGVMALSAALAEVVDRLVGELRGPGWGTGIDAAPGR